MRTTTEQIVAKIRVDDGEQFSPARYPYTYACDLLRKNQQVIPAEVWQRYEETHGQLPTLMNRADASRIRQLWGDFEQRGDEEFAEVLADAFLTLHGIEKPEGSRS
jgi:hypothetical protein